MHMPQQLAADNPRGPNLNNMAALTVGAWIVMDGFMPKAFKRKHKPVLRVLNFAGPLSGLYLGVQLMGNLAKKEA